MFRSFTYIDDIIESLMRLLAKYPKPDLDLTKIQIHQIAGVLTKSSILEILNQNP